MPKENLRSLFVALILSLVMVSGIASGRTIYVDDDGTVDFSNIQAAINDANHGDIIEVQPGTYTGAGNRDIDFLGKAITVRSIDPNDPNIVAATIIDCNGTGEEPHRGFYFLSGEDAHSVLDGLTITNGFAKKGGGIQCINSSPTLSNCVFSRNFAIFISGSDVGGGGMYNENGSPRLMNCTFKDNTTSFSDGAGMYNTGGRQVLTKCTFINNSILGNSSGGGMFNKNCSVILEDCSFIGNSAHGVNYGGGICNWESNPTITNCIFIDNWAGNDGGGMCNWESSATITNCTFILNRAEKKGGGILNSKRSHSLLTNCIFTGNSAGRKGGAMCIDQGGWIGFGSNPILTNCTFTGNYAEEQGGGMNIFWSNATLTNCIFTSNSANAGGGIFNWHMCNLVLTNCSFIGNLAQSGWSLACDSALQEHPSDIQVANCIFWHEALPPPGQARNPNPADGATGVSRIADLSWTAGSYATSHDLYFGASNPPPFISNRTTTTFDPGTMPQNTTYYWCIDELNAWGKTTGTIWSFTTASGPVPPLPPHGALGSSISANLYSEISNVDNSNIAITYSDVHGGWSGEGNIDTDPCFVEPGYWDNNDTRDDPEDDVWVEGDYHLLLESPCINAGDPDYIAAPNETDLDGLPRVIGGRIDMGAYEFDHTPIADAGPDQTVEAQAPWGATVTLDGSGSSDADSTPGTIDHINDFNWYELDPCDPNADVLLGSVQILDCNLSIGEHIILLEVIDKVGASDTNEVTIIVQDTTPPVFTSTPLDLIVECDGSSNLDELNAWLASAAAVDECGDVTITNDFVGLLNGCGATGAVTVIWTAEDESGNTTTTPPATFTIVDTTPPVITCPPDVTLQCPADTSVEANGSATAGDTCSSVTITHSDVWQTGCGNTGTLTRTWTATDECGNGSSCVQTITVVDTTPPQFQFSVAPTMLWPPDHKMYEITPSWTVSDECVPSPDVSLVSIMANEGDNTIGDGHTSNDIQINEDGSIYLRSERSGTGTDRLYTITYQAVDDCGNTTLRSATVSIPHDFKVLARIASRWLWAGPGRIPEDLNGDGIVNLVDFARFAENWIR